MTEAEWRECTNLEKMLGFLRDKVSGRKLRLFACAYCRRIWGLLPRQARHAVQLAERVTDGLVSDEEWAATSYALVDYYATVDGVEGREEEAFAASTALGATADPMNRSYQLHITLRVYNARRAITKAVSRSRGQPATPEDVKTDLAHEERAHAAYIRDLIGPLPFRPITFDAACLTPTVKALAQTIYDERRFQDLPVLADALEQAGCTNTEILNHCREPGEHVRGCWAVDLILGKQ